MVKKLALVTLCVAALSSSAWAQDAKAVIASAKKAMGDPTSITYSGSAKDVAFQQCGANKAAMNCQGTHDPMRPIDNYVRVIDLSAPASRHTGATNNIGAGGSTTITPGTFFQQVTPQQADVRQPWAQSVELYITPWGFLKGAEANNATAKKDGKYTVVISWSPAVKAPSGKAYTINGYVNGQNQIERVETWVGENIMGDMHIVATYSGWKDFGGAMAPAKIVPDARRLAVLRSERHQREGQSSRSRVNRTGAGTAGGPWRRSRRPGRSWRRTGHDGDERETRQQRLPADDGPWQLRLTAGGIQRPHHDARGRPVRSPRAGLHRGNEEDVSEQADSLCHEHARALGSHRRPAGAGRGRRDDRHAEEQRSVLRPRAQHAAHAAERHAWPRIRRRRRSRPFQTRRSTRMAT